MDGGRPCKPREQQSGRQCLIHEPDECFDGHHQVGHNAVGTDLSVADSREGLDAEEERPSEPTAQHLGTRPHQRVRSARQVGQGENQVEREIKQGNETQETGPGHPQQLVIRREALEDAEARTHDVEGAVAVQQASTAFAADVGAEAEIAIARLLFRCAPRGERTRFKG